MRVLKLPLFITLLVTLAAFFAYLLLTGRDYQTYIAEHAHTHIAPHGGTLLVLGDHLGHLELVLDRDTGRLTAFSLDGHAEQPVRLPAKGIEISIQATTTLEWQALTLEARSNPLTGEVLGDTSEFSTQHPDLVGRESFAIRLQPMQFRGVDVPGFKTRFPEGNEILRAPAGTAETRGEDTSGH